MLTKEEVLSILKDVKYNSRYNIIKIGLVGSFARDEQTESSDIDIDVIFDYDNPNILDDYFSFQKELEEKTKRKIDMVDGTVLKNRFFIEQFNKDVIYCE